MKVSNVISAPRSAYRHWAAALAVAVASSILPLLPAQSLAERTVALESHRGGQVADRFRRRRGVDDRALSQSEIDALSVTDFGMEVRPLQLRGPARAAFSLSRRAVHDAKGDLVARAEAHEQTPRFTPLAVRKGDQYCNLESEEQCYGSFASVCEFTDLRDGPTRSSTSRRANEAWHAAPIISRGNRESAPLGLARDSRRRRRKPGRQPLHSRRANPVAKPRAEKTRARSRGRSRTCRPDKNLAPVRFPRSARAPCARSQDWCRSRRQSSNSSSHSAPAPIAAGRESRIPRTANYGHRASATRTLRPLPMPVSTGSDPPC